MEYKKKKPQKKQTLLNRNKGIIGDTIETMVERLMEGEGIEGIEDRDLVYNDGETNTVNPITNIRSDKMELMLEEKIGEQNFKNRKMQLVKDEQENKSEQQEITENE